MKREIELILDSTHDAMIAVDADGVITLFNKAAEKLTKIDVSNALGFNVREVIDSTRLPNVIETGESELNRRQPLGEIEIITNRMPVRDDLGNVIGAIAVFRDITEMAQLAEELTDLKETKEMLNAIFEATEDAISVVDENGMGVLVNKAYSEITGFVSEEIIGKECTVDMIGSESVHLKVLSTGEPVRGVRMRVGKRGRDVIIDAAPIFAGGTLKGSVAVIHDLTDILRLTRDLDAAKSIIRNLEAKYTFEDILGETEVLVDPVMKAKVAAETPVTVLLRGESGTGKELFAHAIHNRSSRKYNQFVRVNCAAISPSLLESELFGYVEGAFTGAQKGGKKGYFEQADGGTILLDEISEVDPAVQVKLLRVLQEREILRVGSTRPIPIDVRVISATNEDLEKLIEEGKFRKDLYYRLNVFPINIPSLREHKGDIGVIAKSLITRFNQEYGRSVEDIDKDALGALMEYDWPGNVRELENIIGRAMISLKMTDKLMKREHLPLVLFGKPEKVHVSSEKITVTEHMPDLKEYLREKEKEYINAVLEKNGFNKTKTARELGMSIRSLYYKINE